MGLRSCSGDHDYVTTEMGAGLRRKECARCRAFVVDLDAAGGGSSVSAPGLFRPSRPTLFTVLAEERRAMEAVRSEPEPIPSEGARYVFGVSGAGLYK